MLHRVRATVRWPASSGLATWARDQMAVRYEQAVTIRAGEPAEEPRVNEVRDGGELFVCDLPLADQAAAEDALATLTAPSVWDQAVLLDDGPEGPSPSWAEYHLCDHAEDSRGGCAVEERRESAHGHD